MTEPLKSPHDPDPPRRFPLSQKLLLLLIRRIGLGIGAGLLAYGVLRGWPNGSPDVPCAVAGALMLGFFGPALYCEPQ